MSAACTCGEGVKNLGLPNCAPVFDVANGFWFQELINEQGVQNSISLAGGVYDQTFFDALVNQTDVHKRIYPTPEIENYTWVVADSEKQTTSNGNTYVLRKGSTTVSFDLIDVPAAYATKMESMVCPKMQFYIVDKVSNLVGDVSEAFTADKLKGIPIQKGSFDVKYTPAQDGNRSMITITFVVPPQFSAGDLGFIGASSMTYDVNNLKALLDVNSVIVGSVTTTTFTADFYLDYGTAGIGIPVEGLVVGDFTMAEITPTPGAITITSVTESSTVDGRYAFVMPTQTSGDSLRLRLAKTGFEMSQLTVTVP
jgi:hypothetical protein